MTTLRRGATLLAVAVALLVLVALGAASPRPAVVEIIPRPLPTASVAPESLPSINPLPTQSPIFPLPEGEPLRLPDWADDVVRILVTAAVVGLIALFLYRLAGELVLTERRQAGEPGDGGADIPEIDDEELAEAVEATVESLRRGIAVDGAIIACWRRLERVAASSGIPRKPAQTSHEFTVEVLGHAVVDAAALEDLAELYRQAMFSTYQLTDAHRHRAIADLEALSAQLDRRTQP